MRKRLTPHTRSADWQGSLFCTAPIGLVGTAPVDFAGFSLGSDAFPLALALWAFLGASIWIFQRWGRAPAAHLPESAKRVARTQT